jgi:formamidopyrimidine-DNA glycosylase
MLERGDLVEEKMPELPEVEVVRRGLEKILLAPSTSQTLRIEKIECLRADLRGPIPRQALQRLEGARVLAVHRRAKYLLIETDKGGILSHLGMTGTWRVAPPGEEKDHDHIYLHLSSGVRLAYRDPRRFGLFETYDVQRQKSHPRLKNLGPEPFDALFSGDFLWQFFRGKKTTVKAAIMNQECVVGVGNIYASEALFLAGISPLRKAQRISRDESEKIVQSIRETLQTAIDAGGSSISDFYSFDGESGEFQNTHAVYARDGELCRKCDSKIRARVISGRSTYWCPSCQK